MIRVSQIVACKMFFNLFYERGWQGGVFKVMKNCFLVFFRCLVSPSIWAGGDVAYIRIEWSDKTATCSLVPSCFLF